MTELTAENPVITNKTWWQEKLDGSASLSRIEKNGRSITIVVSEHFSKQAAEYFQKEIAPRIANPEEWLFLIEGKDSGVYECEVARRIAEERNIPIEDPIFSPFSPEIINMYLRSELARKTPKEVLVGQLAADLANARGTTNLREIATILGVESPEVIYRYIAIAAREKERAPEDYQRRTDRMWKELVNISNIVSAQVLRYFLRHYPEKRKIVLYVGKYHEEIVTMDISQIPEPMKLNDRQIRELLDKRRRIRTQWLLKKFGSDLSNKRENPSPSNPPTPRKQVRVRRKSVEPRISKVLNEIPSLPPELRDIIKKWSNNIFGLEYVRKRGYREYLDSNNSLHQLWGAAALLADRVEIARKEGRELTPAEKEEIRGAFFRAAASRRKEDRKKQGDEIAELAKNIDVLIQIFQMLGQ